MLAIGFQTTPVTGGAHILDVVYPLYVVDLDILYRETLSEVRILHNPRTNKVRISIERLDIDVVVW